MMQTVSRGDELRAIIREQQRQGKIIGFVPTMGNLHDGHIELVRQGQQRADFMVASIFVNPTQFGANEDFSSYPRTLAEDQEKLAAAGCNLLFAPGVEDVYPEQSHDWVTVSVSGVSERHCGANRPGHFNGVALVVSKLFNLVDPNIALFGKKDFQQLAVIRRLVKALNFGIEIIGVDTVREPNGLARSSRNGFLTAQERERAALIYQLLCECRDQLIKQPQDYSTLENAAMRRLQEKDFQPEYFSVCNADTLAPATQEDRNLVILTAARLGTTRLIDNLDFQLE